MASWLQYAFWTCVAGRAREAQLQETVIQERSPDRDPWPFLALARPVEKDRASLALLAIFTFVLQVTQL